MHSEIFPIGDRIRAAREARKLTQRDLAAAIGVERSAVSQWESGSRQPDIVKLGKIAEFLEVPIGYLYGSDADDTVTVFEDYARLNRLHRSLASEFIRMLHARQAGPSKADGLELEPVISSQTGSFYSRSFAPALA